MKHFFESINGWFSFEHLYSDMVSQHPDGAKFVEVGTWTGKSLMFLIVEAINAGKKFEISAVDSFTFGDYPPNEGRNILDVLKENIAKADYPVNIIVGDSSGSASQFENRSLDFVFLDADHVKARIESDIKAWLPKIKNGGILAGHDYCEEHPGVIQAVDEIFGNDWDKSHLDEKCWVKHIHDSSTSESL